MLHISFVTVFAIPKLLCLLWTSPPRGSRVIRVLMRPFVHVFKKYVCNINFGPTVWAQSILPTAKGGLGICSVLDLCLLGFLSSCHGTSDLVASLLSPSGITGDDPLLLEAINRWFSKFPLPPEDQQHIQHKWDELLYEQHYSSLLNSTLNDQSKVRGLCLA